MDGLWFMSLIPQVWTVRNILFEAYYKQESDGHPNQKIFMRRINSWEFPAKRITPVSLSKCVSVTPAKVFNHIQSRSSCCLWHNIGCEWWGARPGPARCPGGGVSKALPPTHFCQEGALLGLDEHLRTIQLGFVPWWWGNIFRKRFIFHLMSSWNIRD